MGGGGGEDGWTDEHSTFQPTNFFHKESKFKKRRKKNFFLRGVGEGCGGVVGGMVGSEVNGGGVDGWTDELLKPICPFNFLEVGGITMH